MKVSKEVSKILSKWREKAGSLIMILHEVQNEFGYIPRKVAMEISQELEIPLARIYEVITFYHFFKLESPGKYTISVCNGTACYLKGAQEILRALEEFLHIKEGQTTKDGLFHLESVRCLGCCGLAPVIMINGKVYGKVKKEQIPEILSQYS